MTLDTAPVPPTHAPSARPSAFDWNRRDRVVGWLLLVAWAAVMVSTVLLGTRESTYAELQARVASGEVPRVEVAGDGLPPGSDGGYSVREVRWRVGLTTYTADVTEAGNTRVARRLQRQRSLPVVVGSVEDHLRQLDGDVRFLEVERRSSSFEIAGRAVPGAVALGWLGMVLACIFVAGGPRTWRATGWAWTWFILLVPPYGVLAFLVLGGPLGLLPPRDPGKARLTGGWAFILALFLGGGIRAS